MVLMEVMVILIETPSGKSAEGRLRIFAAVHFREFRQPFRQPV